MNKTKIPEAVKLPGELRIWKPSFRKFYFKKLPFKYVVWWFFHFLRVFGNKKLQIWHYYMEGCLVHFFCIVPQYYRWPFMAKKDVQITFIITEKKWQGKGIAFQGICVALNNLILDGNVWYVTEERNIPSQKLATKLGFELYRKGYSKNILGGIIKTLRIL